MTQKINRILDGVDIVEKEFGDFIENGGTVGGTITSQGFNGPSSCSYSFGSGNLQMRNGDARIDFINGDGTKPPRFEPLTGGDYDLGDPSYYFKDIWAGPYSKSTNGYTKLPNGMIMQWGSTQIVKANEGYHQGTYSARQDVYLPISFPNAILSVTGTSVNTGTTTCCHNPTRASFILFVSRMVDIEINTTVNWIAIGY